MTNEEFQKAVLGELKEIKSELKDVKGEMGDIKSRVENIEERQKGMETRQDEIYLVTRAIEHNNQVGKSELDSHNIRIAKVEGKIKRVAKACNEEIEVDKASSL